MPPTAILSTSIPPSLNASRSSYKNQSPTSSAGELLHDPFSNQDTATPAASRTTFHLHGLIPPAQESLDLQVQRALLHLREKHTNLDKALFLNEVKAGSWNVFAKLVIENAKECLPLVYTPTVGELCSKYSKVYTRPEGLYISLADENRVDEILDNWTAAHLAPGEQPSISVVTDGSRILGLGDLGLGGIGIAIGKLSLYVVAAGIRPHGTIPIVIDVGTDNIELLNDPLYLGLRQRRPPQDEALAFAEKVTRALHTKWPDLIIQYEDWSAPKAFATKAAFAPKMPLFNDDLDGTGAVIRGGFEAAARRASEAAGKDMLDQTIVMFGAGSAGIGVCEALVKFFTNRGWTEEQAKERFWLVDTKGLVTLDRGDKLAEHKLGFARRTAPPGKRLTTLKAVVDYVRPTALIGLSTTPGTFTPEIMRSLAQYNTRPIIMPLSNPSHLSECTFQEAFNATDGKVVFASGSPFPPVVDRDGNTREGGQGNNMYIFPGLGLGAILCRSRLVTDEMIEASALALAESLTEAEKADDLIYPRLTRIRAVSAFIAARVIRKAQEQNIDRNTRLREYSDEELLQYVKSRQWAPAYPYNYGYEEEDEVPSKLAAL